MDGKAIPEECLAQVTHAHTISKNDNKLEKYLIEPDHMSQGRTLLSTRPAAGRQVGRGTNQSSHRTNGY